MTEKYVLFAGDNYYPSGGFGDFIAFGDLEELEAMLPKLGKKDWAHIADMEAKRIVRVTRINKYNRTVADSWEEPGDEDQPTWPEVVLRA